MAAEGYAVRLSDRSEEECVPNEFRVHHGSLSKIEREAVEQELQRGETPVTALGHPVQGRAMTALIFIYKLRRRCGTMESIILLGTPQFFARTAQPEAASQI